MTIRTQLALAYVAAIALTIALLGTLLWWQLAGALRTSLDQTLQTRAAAAVTTAENGGQLGLQEGDATAGLPVFVALVDGTNRIVDATAGVPDGFVPAGPAGAAQVGLGGITYATFTVPHENGVRAVAGSSLAGIDATLDRFTQSMIVVGLIASVVSLACGWLLAGRALRPVAAITAEASQIGAADLARRLPVPHPHDEMRSLASTLNGMLDRVAESVRRQGRFVAAASHDLRTPLAALQAELELANDPRTTHDQMRDAVRAAHADAVRLGTLAAALLDLTAAAAGGRELVRSSVPAAELVEAVARRVEPFARERGVVIRSTVPDTTVRVDRVRLEQAVTNIVTNAITYSPRDAEVAISATLEAVPTRDAPRGGIRGEMVLTMNVDDSGAGIPSSFADRVFEPFQRGPNATGQGSGLGLATAAAAVAAHRGSIGFEGRSGGGTRVWVRVPA
jgi:two-component system, OmpR family, sensor kinase